MDSQQHATPNDEQSETPAQTEPVPVPESASPDAALLEAPDLEGLEFLLDEIEDQIAPLA